MVGKGWSDCEAVARALDAQGFSVTQILCPAPPKALWVGVYGTAKVHEGAPLVVTSNGKRHPV